MLKKLPRATFAVFWILFGTGCDLLSGDGAQNEAGRLDAVDFRLSDEAGKVHTLSGIQKSGGSVVLVHFWATWCPPCILELPPILDFAKNLEGTSLRLVTVSLDENWKTANKIFPKAVAKNVISLIDPDLKTSEAYGSYKFPETYLISPDLKILKKWVGPQPWSSPEMTDFIRALTASGS